VIDDFVNFIDLAPTMLEAAGVSVPAEMTGRSLLPVLLSGRSGRVDPARGWTVAGLEWHGEEPELSLAARTIRDERYQYIVNYSATPRMRLDPRERRPDAEYAASAASLDELGLVARHPEHPSVRSFTELFVAPRPREELYDAQEDPWQRRNLATDPALGAVKARLRTQLEEYQRRTGDPRVTGDLGVFEATRTFVLDRKFGADGYGRRKGGKN
jgi:arylsulfatase A-like enzyme